jgi:hypothetical protein
LPAVVAVHERVELPDPPVMLVELRVHERFVEFVVTDSVTVPEKPLMGEIVIDDVPATPVFALTLVGLAEIAKSCGNGAVT